MKLLRYFFAVSIVLLVNGCSNNKSPEELVSDAEKYIKEGNQDAAIIQLKNAISSSPNLANARLMLGQIYLNQSDFSAASKELYRALDIGADRDIAVPILVKANYYQGAYEELDTVIKKYGELGAQATSSVALFSYLSKLRLSDSDIGLEEYKGKLLGDDLVIAEVNHAYAKGELEQALELTASYQQDPHEQIEKQFILGAIHYRMNNFQEAESLFKTILSSMPSLHYVRFLLIESQLALGASKDAQENVAKLLKVNASNPYVNLLNARALFQNAEYKEALPFASKAIQNGMNTDLANLIAGVSAYKSGQMEHAYRYLGRAVKSLPLEHIARKLLAEVQLSLGYTEEAKHALEQFKKYELYDANLFSQTGVQLALEGDVDAAKSFMGKANAIDQNNALNLLRAGMLKVATNDMNGIADIEASLEKDQNVQEARLFLVEAHLQNNDPQAALKVAEEWIKTDPASGKALKGLVYWRQGEKQTAEREFKEALEHDETHLGAGQYLLNLYERDERYAEALAVGKKILTAHPDNLLQMANLVRLFYLAGQKDKLAPYFEQRMAEHPDIMNIKYGAALAYRALNTPEKAVELLKPQLANLNEYGYMILGDANLQLRDLDEAREIYSKWRSNEKTNIQSWLRSIGVEEIDRKLDAATRLTDEALSYFPNASSLQLLKLNFLTQMNRLKDANDLLSSLRRADIKSVYLNKYAGELAIASKSYENAEELLSTFYQDKPSFSSAVLLAKALEGTGKVDEAATLLEDAFDRSEKSGVERHILAEFYLHNNRYEDAAKHYREVLAEYPKHLVALNNMANIQVELGQYTDALVYAEKAHEVAPKMPEILDTLGWSLYKSGEFPAAQNRLEEALSVSPNNTAIQLHLAEVLISRSEHIKARMLLNKINAVSDKERAALAQLRAKM
ncbi:XrtA/PEP-CTERM system TPR-repeat protein PrsT [Bowmanella denitrificans]|uniref:XrtA/PEP-CTERM system TPR-repeat protein PrsT n=1 Tax=Bowmanella denitrificans TaxID=366582 RepID=UPI000C9AAECA|nr:XrtA/PEP-CTERM system TPR-repeat protein PrsT [Bowmanella denitrificans]